MKRLFFKIEGIVQGVGFRPFVYNEAVAFNIKGWVNNNSDGVYIDAEGGEEDLRKFIYNIKTKKPPLAKIENIIIQEKENLNYKDFQIKESERRDNKITLISPDIAVCKECIDDITNNSNRRHKYSFTNCTNCGPRFSIIKSIPYDRDKTTMNKFNMCKSCQDEYTNPASRRFHAQPIACENCGPNLWLEDSKGIKFEVDDIFGFARQKLKEGKIFAIKGLGGFHFVCDARNEEAVKLLRMRKNRPYKAFAVMMKDIEMARRYCYINMEEEKVLTGKRKPIVILDQVDNYDLSQYIAPNQKTLGVMLPYTPLHYLLFEDNVEVLIMTSANINGLPLEYKNDGATKKLKNIADYFLMHNREIYIPIDDSLVRVINDEVLMIRRARGYVPEPIKKGSTKEILACGSNMKNTFCIGKDNFLFLSQHNGDLENLETIKYYKNNIEHFKNIFNFVPKYVVCDMHPSYTSTKYAYNSSLPKIKVQHHHAHIVSCLAENNVNKKVIGIAFDGTGYGTDKKIWGGEFFLCDKKEFTRLGHLDYVKMPGGEKAIKEPWRMSVSYIYKMFESKMCKKASTDDQMRKMLVSLYGDKAINILAMIKANINSPETSSMGRFFDAAASLTGVRDYITYEGQAAIEFETIAANDSLSSYDYDIIKENFYIIRTEKIIEGILKDRLSGEETSAIAGKFHKTIVKLSMEMCKLIRKDTGVNDVALSGGVFQNARLLKSLINELRNDGFIVYTNKLVPANDGGIALGQIVIANEIIN